MSSHSDHNFSGQSYGWDSSISGLLNAISKDIATLIGDIFKLLEAEGCCPCPPLPGHCPPPCYCPGTLILTSTGEVAVEDLSVDDLVVTASGAHRPIRWIGRRQFDVQRHPVPSSVRPVRIASGAFGDQLPHRDLVVSPGHSIFVEDVLIPVRFLVNGTTIAQDNDATSVIYYHVELDAHDILIAEGLAAESYLDTGNRSDFENGGALIELHPTFEPKVWADTCVPLVKVGPTVERAKLALIARAAEFGHRVTGQNGLHILADGKVIDGSLDGSTYRFELPAGCAEASLVSRSWVPAQLLPNSQDDRTLGVCVARLDIDNAEMDLSTMTSGWLDFDFSGRTSYRWTNGSAELPPDARTVTVELCGKALYWASEDETPVALQHAA